MGVNGNGVSSLVDPPAGQFASQGETDMAAAGAAMGGQAPGIDKARVRAIAAKISAARELARRLADEKAALDKFMSLDEAARAGMVLSGAEGAAAAAAKAARADALARALKKAQRSKEVITKLSSQNEALKVRCYSCCCCSPCNLACSAAWVLAAGQQRLQGRLQETNLRASATAGPAAAPELHSLRPAGCCCCFCRRC